MPEDHDPLVERVRQGDPQALADFIDDRRGVLLGIIQRQLSQALRNKLEPEDILQEVSADAVRSLPEIDLTTQDPFGWLCQLIERRTVDAWRHFFASQMRAADKEVALQGGDAEKSRANLVDLLVASMTTASAAFSKGQREIRMLAALSELPQDQQDALRMRYLEGLPSKEIATRLGKSDGSLRVMLTRSLSRLRARLDQD